VKILTWLQDPRHRLDIVAGFIDGILNSLTLAAAKLTTQGGLTLLLVGKVAVITACTTGFVFFVAHYAQLRSELIRSARELNLLSHGKLATTRLGTQILLEAIRGAITASVCSVFGSTLPLAISLAVPQVPMAGLVFAICLLGFLGWLLARNIFGSPVSWAGGLMLGGIAVTMVGVRINVLG
jgi:hypothetical protein